MARPLRISPIALNATDRKVLGVATNLIGSEGIVNTLLPDNDPHGHLLVIDGDNKDGQRVLADARDGQVKLVFSAKRMEGKNLVWQAPPVRVAELQELLTRICLRMKASFAAQAGSQPEAAPAARQEHPAQTPARTLFHVLLEAKEQQICQQILAPDDCLLLIGGHNGSVAAKDQVSIEHVLQTPFKKLHTEQIDIIAFAKAAQQLSISALDTLLWQAGVDHSDGRLLEGHDVNQAVRLKAWPNFTRTGFRQSHFKLAAIMARQAISLKELKREADVPHNEVVSFYNAAFAVGLIDRGAAAPAEARQPRTIRPRARSMLGMLARRLGFR